MAMFVDARVPVLLGGIPGPGDAVLVEHGIGLPAGVKADAAFVPDPAAHQPGCACCVVRGPAAMALGGLFAARARGSVPFFRRVVALTGPAGDAELRAVLAGDPLVSARFRLAETGR